MAISTYQTYLLIKPKTDLSSYANVAGGWLRLPNIKDYPDLDGEKELLEATTLDDNRVVNIQGVESAEGQTFTMNYDTDGYNRLKSIEGIEYCFAIAFGKEDNESDTLLFGRDGGVVFNGTLSINRTGKGVNEVRDMVVTLYPSDTGIDIVGGDTATDKLKIDDYENQFFGEAILSAKLKLRVPDGAEATDFGISYNGTEYKGADTIFNISKYVPLVITAVCPEGYLPPDSYAASGTVILGKYYVDNGISETTISYDGEGRYHILCPAISGNNQNLNIGLNFTSAT